MPRRCDFMPESRYVRGGIVCGVVGNVHIEEHTRAALEEAAWLDRSTKQVIVEELIVAYLRDRFPGRFIATREEIRYGDVELPEDFDDEDFARPPLRPDARHFEHDELHWRRNARGRPTA